MFCLAGTAGQKYPLWFGDSTAEGFVIDKMEEEEKMLQLNFSSSCHFYQGNIRKDFFENGKVDSFSCCCNTWALFEAFLAFQIHICILLKNDEKREDNQSINQSINQWNFIKLSDDPRIG